MKKRFSAVSLFTTLLICTLPAGASPPPGDVVYLFLRDGGILSGTIVAEDESTVTLRLESGEERTVARENIERTSDSGEVRAELLEGSVIVGTVVIRNDRQTVIATESFGRVVLMNDRIVSLDFGDSPALYADLPQDTRLTFIANGFSLKKGEGYYQNVWVLGNLVAYGLTDHLSISAGIVPLFFFDGTSSPALLGLKGSIPLGKNVHIGIGGQAGTLLFEGGTFFGDAYGVLTVGSRQSHFNLGGGALFADDEALAVIAFGGTRRISSRWAFVTENYLLPTEDFTGGLSLGGRFLTGDASVDFALAIPVNADMEGFIAVPWLGVTIPF